MGGANPMIDFTTGGGTAAARIAARSAALGSRRLRGALLALILAGVAASAAASDASPSGGPSDSFLVTRVEYRGSFKTKRARLEAVTGLRAGEKASPEDLPLAERRLADTGLYSSVRISAREDGLGKALTVELEEKLTLVPLPIVSASDGEVMAGLFVFDSDFLGTGNSIYAGVVGGAGRLTGNLGLNYLPPRSPNVKIVLASSGGFESVTESWADGASYAEYDLNSAEAEARLSFRERSRARPALSLGYRWMDPSGEGARSFDDDYSVLLPGIGLEYEDLRGEDWFEAGVSASASYAVGLLRSGGDPYQSIELKGRLSLLVPGGENLVLGAALLYGDAPGPLRFNLRGGGFRTLPGGESFSNRAAAAFAQFEAPALELGWATFTACGFYEAGAYRQGPEGSEESRWFHGPGIGMRMYLRNVAMPALGVDYAYNLPERNPVFSATLGFSM